jgi:geranylgeranyl reductase family protein
MYDLIVVGAGPAGASAARTAAQLGLKTLLLEKEKFPRDKLCGGGVTPKVLKLLDFHLSDELIEYEAQSSRIHVGAGCFKFETRRPLVYMTSRAKLDSFLANKAAEAGAELKDGTPVRRIERRDDYVRARTSDGSFQGRMLIGADGMGGPTASYSRLYDRWKPHQVAYAIESEVPAPNAVISEFGGSECYFDVYFGVSSAGYGWVFPKDDHLTVGVGCRLSKLRDAHGLFDGFVKTIPALAGIEIPSPRAHLIPLGGASKVPSVTERILLAGDSAGFAEPLFGEGIYFAILGAQIAAQTAAEACHKDHFDTEFLKRYEKSCRRAFGTDFDIAYRVACFSYLEQYDMERVSRFFFSESKVQECMVGLIDGSLRYRDVQRKLMWPFIKYQLARHGLLPFYS